jgi:H/ACA ribonucleoprotein complex subunit 4
VHEEVVLMTTKGEAIALGIAQMSTVELSSCDHGVVAKIKRCIMERDLYPRRWGLGPVALEKKKLKSDGKLDKFGRPNEATPTTWTTGYTDYHAPMDGVAFAGDSFAGTRAAPLRAGKTDATDVAAAPAIPPAPEAGDEEDEEMDKVADEGAPVKEGQDLNVSDKKKRKKHDGETPEERAERKKRKKEKKEKKEKRKSKTGGSDGSD